MCKQRLDKSQCYYHRASQHAVQCVLSSTTSSRQQVLQLCHLGAYKEVEESELGGMWLTEAVAAWIRRSRRPCRATRPPPGCHLLLPEVLQPGGEAVPGRLPLPDRALRQEGSCWMAARYLLHNTRTVLFRNIHNVWMARQRKRRLRSDWFISWPPIGRLGGWSVTLERVFCVN